MAISVVLTDTARALLAEVRAARGDTLTLVIGNGCCDSTAPFLFAHHFATPTEREVGVVDGILVVLDETLLPLFDGREVVIDAARATTLGEDSFSCEAEHGMRFSLDRLPAAAPQTSS